MELRHLRYFVAVGRCLSFTKAAESLHISQPPLSRQIQEFEEEVGAPLFDRHAKKTSLTEAGAYLLEEAERLLEGIDSACRTAHAISVKTRTLKIGCASFMLSRTLTPFITEVKERMPDLTLEILVMSTEAQERALLSGAIDVGFVRYWIPTESLAFDPISHESLALICPENYQAEGSVEAIMAGLAEKPFIGVSRSAAKGLSETISAVCGEYGLQPVLAYECNDAFSIMGLVAAGLGWSIVPGFDLSETGAPTVTRIPLVQKISIGISYRLAGLSAPAEAFISHARAFFSRTT